MAKRTCEIEKITPAQATAILNGNQGNRPIRDARVDELIRSIKEKRWHLTNDAIAMTGASHDKPGRLLNGQHRLYACVMADMPIEVLMLYGVHEDSYAVMDTGAKRSASDLLPSPYQNQRRGATQVVFCYRRDNGLSCTAYNIAPGNDEILSEYESHPMIALTVDADLTPLKKITKAVVGPLGAFALLREHDREKADAFIARVLSGHALAKDSPELTLRNRLISEATSRSSVRRATAATYAAMVIKAWNAVETKSPLGKIFFRDGEAFPRIVDLAKQPPRVLRRIGRVS